MADKSKLLIIAQDITICWLSHLSSCRAARQLSWMAQHLPNQLVCALAGKVKRQASSRITGHRSNENINKQLPKIHCTLSTYSVGPSLIFPLLPVAQKVVTTMLDARARVSFGSILVPTPMRPPGTANCRAFFSARRDMMPQSTRRSAS